MEDRMYFANCPMCGRVLLKSTKVNRAELHCHKCHEVIEITIKMHKGNVMLFSNQKNNVTFS